jgi:hypothetical protein
MGVTEPADTASRRRWALVVVGVCVAVAIATLATPAAITYDAWAWLSWGREISNGTLDTTAGPSWKPLPVLVTTLLPVTGGAAPVIWLVLTRVFGLLVLVFAYRVAARFAGWVAGAVAVALVLITPDLDPRYLRLLLEGHTATLTALLTLAAIDFHLGRRRVVAFLLVLALALDRPEAWPFLLLYGLWLFRHEPRLRWLVGVGVLLVPALWFGVDWWGSGSPLHGADAAQVSATDDGRLGTAFMRVGQMVTEPAFLLAAVALGFAQRRRAKSLYVIAAIAVGWSALVVAMTAQFGYAALSRFFLPAAVIVCVLAGIGTVWLWQWLAPRISWVLATVLLVALFAPFVAVRAAGVPEVFREVEARQQLMDGLDTAIDAAGGRDAVVGCGRVAIDDLGIPAVALAYKLDVPMGEIQPAIDGVPGVTFVSADPERYEFVTGRPSVTITGTTVARTPAWNVVESGCGTRA